MTEAEDVLTTVVVPHAGVSLNSCRHPVNVANRQKLG